MNWTVIISRLLEAQPAWALFIEVAVLILMGLPALMWFLSERQKRRERQDHVEERKELLDQLNELLDQIQALQDERIADLQVQRDQHIPLIERNTTALRETARTSEYAMEMVRALIAKLESPWAARRQAAESSSKPRISGGK